jgi:drug/metabolite transporter (DMT)-like permease
MEDPVDSWFSEETSRAFVWLAFLSFLSLLGPYALTGRHRRLVTAVWIGALALGAVSLGAAVVALMQGQPPHVVRPLLVTGVVVTIVFAGLYRTLIKAYQEAELRKIAAQDI